ncbi:MAG: hypothetical protein ACLFS5_01790 [Spirochaetaceae bacterium]
MCSVGKPLAWALLLALLPLSWSQAQSSDSSPTLPGELSAELQRTSNRLERYATELSAFSEQNERRIDALLTLSREQQAELEKLSAALPQLKNGLTKAFAALNRSERDSRSFERDKTQAIAQLGELERKLADSERSLQRLRRQIWIERVVIGLTAFGAGYGAAELIGAIAQ